MQRESNRTDKFRSWFQESPCSCLITIPCSLVTPSAVIMTCHHAPAHALPASVTAHISSGVYEPSWHRSSRQTLANSAMQTTLQSTQRLSRSQGLRSQSVNVRAPCFSYSPRLHTLCRGHLRYSSRQSSARTSLAGRSPQICRASQPEASIDQDSDLVGEDAAFFDVQKQTTKSWTLFTGLLLGVLALIYVVRRATQPQIQLGFCILLLYSTASALCAGMGGP